MKIKVAWIGKTKEPPIDLLTNEYLKRSSRYADISGLAVKDEAAILSIANGERKQKKDRHKLILLDSRGRQLSSEELAEFLQREQSNPVPLLFAVGGSDGFTDEARRHAHFTLPPEESHDAAPRTRPCRFGGTVVPRFHHSCESSLSFGTLTLW